MTRCVNLPVPMAVYKAYQYVTGKDDPEDAMVGVLTEGVDALKSKSGRKPRTEAWRETPQKAPQRPPQKAQDADDLEDVSEESLTEEEFEQVSRIDRLFAKNNQGIRRGPEGGLSPLDTPQPCYIATLLGKLGKKLDEAYFCRFVCDDGKERPKPVSPKYIRVALVLYQRYMDSADG